MRVLGELSIDGLDVGSLADRKARLLLRCLAMARGQAVPTAVLAEVLWPDAPPARPADQVSVLASRLRRALGRDAVEHGDHGYRLAYGWLDLDELADLVGVIEQRLGEHHRAGAVAAARVAVSLIRGPLPEAVGDADRVVADHASAVALVRRARRAAATALLADGGWLDALDLAATNAREDPYDEDAVRLMMRADVAGGRPAAALTAYAELRARLAEDLGTEPAAATADLHTAVLRGEHVEQAPAAPAGALVGRTSQLAHLDSLADRLADGTVRVAVVRGEAGIGKTTLLQAWCRTRIAAGDTVLVGTCGALDRAAPLDVLLAAIGAHLRSSNAGAALLGEDAAVLGPLLGFGDGPAGPAASSDTVLGPASLYAAITRVLARIAGSRGLVLVLDDAHLAGPSLLDWARFAARRPLGLLLVAAVRPGEGAEPTDWAGPATDTVNLGPLDRAAIVTLVGAARADDLLRRSGGNPLFLSELAAAPTGSLPASLVAAVERRCDDLGAGADLVRGAAVLGADLDVDLLATVLGRPVLEVLADLETATDRQLLVETSGRFSFRHALVRQALADGTRDGRAALLHREAGRALAGRPGADPVAVAEHARLGDDPELAARALRSAAARAAERFDHATTEALLDQSLSFEPDDATLLARARVRIRLGRYADAEADVTAAATGGSAGCELGAWAAYFDRRFDDAVRYALDGEVTAVDPESRIRCQTVGGRTLHARGDLADADRLLTAAVEAAHGSDRLTAAAWLGVLRTHCGRAEEAIDLLRPATRPGVHVDHTSATLHALLFTGHAHATAGRPAAALAAFASYERESERRQVPRFGGRGTNSAGWVLRHTGSVAEGLDAHHEALDLSAGAGTPELRIAALEDLAEERLVDGDPDAAAAHLEAAAATFDGDLVFGWRLALKLTLLRGRLALLYGDPETALGEAAALVSSAERIAVPRYAAVGRLLTHQAHGALGVPVDLDEAARDLAVAEQSIGIEAWRWAGDTGVALGRTDWVDRAEAMAGRLAAGSGDRGDVVRAAADRALTTWRLRLR